MSVDCQQLKTFLRVKKYEKLTNHNTNKQPCVICQILHFTFCSIDELITELQNGSKLKPYCLHYVSVSL